MKATTTLKPQIEEALKQLLAGKLEMVEIPNSDGLVLIKDGTPEAETRKLAQRKNSSQAIIMGQHEDGGNIYFVCLR